MSWIIEKVTNWFTISYDKIFGFFCNLETKRYSMILFAFLGMFANKKYREDYFIVFIICFSTSFAFFLNLEFLATWTNAKPLYYEDLYLDYTKLPLILLSDNQKKIYKKMYTRILIISNSLLTSSIIVYWVFKEKDSSSYFEIIGVTGGLLQIASLFNTLTGKITLHLIKTYINIKISVSIDSNDDIELSRKSSIGSQCSLDDDINFCDDLKE